MHVRTDIPGVEDLQRVSISLDRLAGPRFQVCILRIPAGKRSVMLRDRLVRIGSCGARWVRVQMILEDLEIDLLEPGLEEPGLPKPSQVVGGIGTAQILYCGVLLVCLVRAEFWRSARTEILRRSQHPRLPGSGEWSYRRIAAPHSGTGWVRPGERLARTVALRKRNDGTANVLTEVQAAEHIAWESHSGYDPRSCRFLSHCR